MDFNQIKDKFSNFRDKELYPQQIEALTFLSESPDKYKILCAPTGSGKSLINMIEGSRHGKFAYLCSSKILQQQIKEEFPEAAVMMGRNNYQCNRIPSMTAADCPFQYHKENKKSCIINYGCEYEAQKKRVLSANIQVLNYWYFLFEANYVGRFSKYELIICDEADALESILAGFVNLVIGQRVITKLKIQPPKHATTKTEKGIEAWTEWAKVIKNRVDDEANALERLISAIEEPEKKMLTEYSQLTATGGKLGLFIDHVDDTWMFQERKGKYGKEYEFKPTWLLPELTHKYFFRHTKQMVFSSATFPPVPVYAKMLGMDMEDVGQFEVGSNFPIENRKIYLDPVANVIYKEMKEAVPKLRDAIEMILAKHPGERGLIHTVSYKLTSDIMEMNEPRLLAHGYNDKPEIISLYRDTPDAVLVSPSSTRGLDLKDDDCRFTIICKMPFQSLGDKLVSARVYGSSMGKYWYRSDAAQEIVQATGRMVRHKADWGVTYILDKQACDRITGDKELFPKWWLEAVEVAW